MEEAATVARAENGQWHSGAAGTRGRSWGVWRVVDSLSTGVALDERRALRAAVAQQMDSGDRLEAVHVAALLARIAGQLHPETIPRRPTRPPTHTSRATSAAPTDDRSTDDRSRREGRCADRGPACLLVRDDGTWVVSRGAPPERFTQTPATTRGDPRLITGSTPVTSTSTRARSGCTPCLRRPRGRRPRRRQPRITSGTESPAVRRRWPACLAEVQHVFTALHPAPRWPPAWGEGRGGIHSPDRGLIRSVQHVRTGGEGCSRVGADGSEGKPRPG